MSKAKQKYYVVWAGHQPGIYSSWAECQAQTKNYPNAIYKSYSTKAEAEEAFHSSAPKWTFKKTDATRRSPSVNKGLSPKIIKESISVDAACSGNPGTMEYQGVWTADKSLLFHFGPVEDGTNNVGEFLAIVHALALLEKKKDSTTPIYTDSKTALSWVRKKKANTKLARTERNKELFEMIGRAEKWLATHTWKNPLIKWETEDWGEIPADFGRK